MTKDVNSQIREPTQGIPPETPKSIFVKASQWLGHNLQKIGVRIPSWLAPVGQAFTSLGRWLVTRPRGEHDISQEVPLEVLSTTQTVRGVSAVLLSAYGEAAEGILKAVEAFKPSGDLSKDSLALGRMKTSLNTLRGREGVDGVKTLLEECEKKISEQEWRLSLASDIARWREVKEPKDLSKTVKMPGASTSLVKKCAAELTAILDHYSSSPLSAVACSDLLRRCEMVSRELESSPELKKTADKLKEKLETLFYESFEREASALSKEIQEYSQAWLLPNIDSFMRRMEALEETGESVQGDRGGLTAAKELLLQKAGELVGEDLASVRASLAFYEKGELEALRGKLVDQLKAFPSLKKAMLCVIEAPLQSFYLEEAKSISKELQSFKPEQGIEKEQALMKGLWARFDALQQKAHGLGKEVDEAVEDCRSAFDQKALLMKAYRDLDDQCISVDFSSLLDARDACKKLCTEFEKTFPPFFSAIMKLQNRIERLIKGECERLCPELKGQEISLDGIADREPLKSRLAEKKKEVKIQAFATGLDKEESLKAWSAFLEKCSPPELMAAFTLIHDVNMQRIWLEEAAKREGFLETIVSGKNFYSSLDASLRVSFVTKLPQQAQETWFQALDPLNRAALMSSIKEEYSSKEEKASREFLKNLSGSLKGALYEALGEKDFNGLVSKCPLGEQKALFSSLDREIYIKLFKKMEKKELFFQALDLPMQKTLLEGLSDEERSGLFLKLGDQALIALLRSLDDERPFLQKIGPMISAQGLASCIGGLSYVKRLSLYRTLESAKLAEVLKAIPPSQAKGIYWEIAKTMDKEHMQALLHFLPSTGEIANSLEALSQAVELMRLVEGLNAAEGKKYKLSVKDGELALVERSSLTSMGVGEPGKSPEALEAVARLLMLTTTSMAAAHDDSPVLEELQKSLDKLKQNDWFTSVCKNQEPAQEIFRATQKNLDALVEAARISSRIDEIKDIEALPGLIEELSLIDASSKDLTARGVVEDVKKKFSEKVHALVDQWKKATTEFSFESMTPLALILARNVVRSDAGSIWEQVLREKLRAMSEPERKTLFRFLTGFWMTPEVIKIFASENVRRSLLIAIDPAICEKEKKASAKDTKEINDTAKYTKLALTRYASFDDIFASLADIVASSPPPSQENIRAFVREWFSLHAGDGHFEKFIFEHRGTVLDVVTPLLEEGKDSSTFFAFAQKARTVSKPASAQELKSTNELIKIAIEGNDRQQVVGQIASDLTSCVASSFLEWNPTTLATAKDPSKAAPEIAALTNSLIYFVSDTIVTQENVDSAVKGIEFWIDVAEKCLEQGNLFAAMAINAALNRSEVSRLLKERADLKKRLQRFGETFATEKSSQKMRAFIKEHKEEGVIPYVGIYQTDATFINDGNPETGALSPKVQLVGKIVEDLREQQKILSAKNKTPPLKTDIAICLEGTVKRLAEKSRSLLGDKPPAKSEEKRIDDYLWKKSNALSSSPPPKA